ncbi:MAG: flagellar biosynthesis protein FliQ [Christensenellales bacterium]
MSQSEVITVMQDGITTIITVAAPILIVAMVVGVIISIFQATTQINEQTLAFVPKIIAILIVILLFGGMMLTNLTDFARRMFGYVDTMLR